MSAAIILGGGPRIWEGERDKEGHRTFKVSQIVETTDTGDGPFVVMGATGLFAVGSSYLVDNDNDVWAYCTAKMKVRVHQEVQGDPPKFWLVDQEFTTRCERRGRCETTDVDDPVLEPQKISGSFIKYTEEATVDRFGDPIVSSSHEVFRGAQIEFDANRPTVRIEQVVSALQLPLFTEMVDTVNDDNLWGLERRKIKLSNVTWERNRCGDELTYTRVFDFDIRFDTFDRDIIDEGAKVLSGDWNSDGIWDTTIGPIVNPDRDNPQHFVAFHDAKGNQIRALLDGRGEPIRFGGATGTGTPGQAVEIHIEKYAESNFLLLGIPTDLESCSGVAVPGTS